MSLRTSCKSTLALLALGLLGSTAHAADLWQDLPVYKASGKPDSAYQALLADAANQHHRRLQVDASQVQLDQNELVLPLLANLSVKALRIESGSSESGNLVWHGLLDSSPVFGRALSAGEALDDPFNQVTLVREGNLLTGNLRVDGQLYKLRPLKDGTHVLIEVDESLVPPDHPAGAEPAVDKAGVAVVTPLVQAKANTVIRVLVHATTAAINASGSISSLIDLAVAEANQSYANSGISITLQLAGKYSIAYTESGSFNTDLSRYRGTSDGYMDSIHSTRNSRTADVAVLFINNSSSCGLASAIGASATTAFAAVHWDCATGYYSFGHEIGHLQAARHDPTNDPTNTPYAYGHGYQYATGRWRTVMAYNCSSGCTRINYWSNPSRTYGGVPMGTSSRSDNARVLNNTRTTVAGFR
ncbi:MAG: peptidyl-Asp metalloendopeptidase [Xanthomonadales bacterium]|nr:peptidyl-Asp metalloendopeptidase [Xanthomonadales bacterium]